ERQRSARHGQHRAGGLSGQDLRSLLVDGSPFSELPLSRPGGSSPQPTSSHAPLSAIFCWASAIAPLRACTWWPSASPTTFLMARVTAGSTLVGAEWGEAAIRAGPTTRG